MPNRVEDGTTCCYALQDKVWVTGPGGESWEVYTVLADAGAELEGTPLMDLTPAPAAASSGGCCGTEVTAADGAVAVSGTVCCAS